MKKILIGIICFVTIFAFGNSVVAAASEVGNEEELRAAIEENVQEIVLKNDVSVSSMVSLPEGTTLNLALHSISGTGDFSADNTQKHVLNISASGVTVKNGNIVAGDGNKHCVYVGNGASNVVLENVTLNNEKTVGGAPLVISSASVEIRGELKLVLGENSWYGINLDNRNSKPSISFENLPVVGNWQKSVITVDDYGDNGYEVTGADELGLSFGTHEEHSQVYYTAKAEASTDGTCYTYFADALKNTQENSVLKLLANVNVDSYTEIRKNLTFDLNGNTLTSTAGGFDIYGAKLTLKNGTVNANSWGAWVQDGGTIEICSDAVVNGGLSQEAKHGGITVQNQGSSADIYGKVTAVNGSAVSGLGNDGDGGTQIIIREGADIQSGAGGIYHPQDGSLTVEGGKITAKGTAIEVKSGNVTISGGDIQSESESPSHNVNSNGNSSSGYALAVVDNKDYSGNASVEILGGKLVGKVGILDDDTDAENNTNELKISGGWFSDKQEEDLCAEGFFPTEDLTGKGVNVPSDAPYSVRKKHEVTINGAVATCAYDGVVYKIPINGYSEDKLYKISAEIKGESVAVEKIAGGYVIKAKDVKGDISVTCVEGFKISYDLNGGSGTAPTDSGIYAADENADIIFDNVPTMEGKVFIGWTNTKNLTENTEIFTPVRVKYDRNVYVLSEESCKYAVKGATELYAFYGVLGDANMNGKLGIEDISLLIDYILNKDTPEDANAILADCDCNGKIQIGDISTLIDLYLKR